MDQTRNDAAGRPGARPAPAAFRFADLRGDAGGDLVALQQGLLAERARIAPKYFYDELGSRLFAALCCLPEYGLTRSEARLFAAQGRQIAGAAGSGALLIDLGAGDCAKAQRLFPLLEPAAYLALDISAEFLQASLARLHEDHPQLPLTGLALDFTRGPAVPEDFLTPARAKRLWFYPGSSIGNFMPDEACAFLARIARACREAPAGGALLVGVDLVKAPRMLEAAYDDALGVTAAFNLNVLNVVNRLLAADFRLADWRHVALFDEAHSRIEMHLEARRALTLHLGAQSRRFLAGERIHTEHSYKWTIENFAALLARAGFARSRAWQDDEGGFAVFLATPA